MSTSESQIERVVALTERLTEALKADVAALDRGNVRIEGGVRVTTVSVSWVYPASAVPTTPASP